MPTPMQMLQARLGMLNYTPQDPEVNAAVNQPILMPEPGTQAAAEAGTSEQGPVDRMPAEEPQQPMSQQEQFMNLLKNQQGAQAAKLKEYLASQKSGLSNMTELAKLRAQTPSQVDLSPLAALSDSLSGGKLLQGYARPQNSEQNAATSFEQLAKIQHEKDALTKLAGAGASDIANNRLLLQAMGMGVKENANEFRQVKSAQDQSSHVEKDLFQRADGFARMKDLFKSATDKSVPPADRVAANTKFESMLNQEQLRLETGARTATSVAEKREAQYGIQKLKELQQSLGGKPINTIPEAELKNSENILNVMGRSYLEQGNRAYDQLKSRANSVQKPVFQQSHDQFLKSYGPILSGKSSGPQVGEVQDGHRFKGGNPADPKSWELVK